MKKVPAIILICSLAVLLLYAVGVMPAMGSADSPVYSAVTQRYLTRGVEETGTKNIVTSVVLNYRAYDTMCEVVLIFVALTGIFAVFPRGRRIVSNDVEGKRSILSSIIVRYTVRLTLPFAVLFSIFTVVYGSLLPGGGFQAAAVIGAIFLVYIFAFGPVQLSAKMPNTLRALMEAAPALAFVVVGTYGLLSGGNYLTYMPSGTHTLSGISAGDVMLLVLEVAIGIGCAVTFVSILLRLLREDDQGDLENTR